MRTRPLHTRVGQLRGRDCIYLDSVTLSDEVRVLILRGEINGDLCERRMSAAFLPFEARFSGVLAVRIVELDSWSPTGGTSFDEILESPWIAELGGKITDQHRHFTVQTYDDVFDVICERVDLAILEPAPQPKEIVAAAGNVLVPALLVLEQQGWTVEHEPESSAPWAATRRSRRILADDPLQLLGLATMSDVRGHVWRASDGEIADVLRRYHLDESAKAG